MTTRKPFERLEANPVTLFAGIGSIYNRRAFRTNQSQTRSRNLKGRKKDYTPYKAQTRQ